MTRASHVLTRAVVYGFMSEPGPRQPDVGPQFVGVHDAPRADVAGNNRVQSALANVLDNIRHNVAATFHHAEHDRLVRCSAPTLPARRTTANVGSYCQKLVTQVSGGAFG